MKYIFMVFEISGTGDSNVSNINPFFMLIDTLFLNGIASFLHQLFRHKSFLQINIGTDRIYNYINLQIQYCKFSFNFVILYLKVLTKSTAPQVQDQ